MASELFHSIRLTQYMSGETVASYTAFTKLSFSHTFDRILRCSTPLSKNFQRTFKELSKNFQRTSKNFKVLSKNFQRTSKNFKVLQRTFKELQRELSSSFTSFKKTNCFSHLFCWSYPTYVPLVSHPPVEKAFEPHSERP